MWTWNTNIMTLETYVTICKIQIQRFITLKEICPTGMELWTTPSGILRDVVMNKIVKARIINYGLNPVPVKIICKTYKGPRSEKQEEDQEEKKRRQKGKTCTHMSPGKEQNTSAPSQTSVQLKMKRSKGPLYFKREKLHPHPL